MNDIEFKMCSLTLNEKIKFVLYKLKDYKINIFETAKQKGLEFVCSKEFNKLIELLDSLTFYLENLENDLSIDRNFTDNEFDNFIKYVLSKTYISEDGTLKYER